MPNFFALYVPAIFSISVVFAINTANYGDSDNDDKMVYYEAKGKVFCELKATNAYVFLLDEDFQKPGHYRFYDSVIVGSDGSFDVRATANISHEAQKLSPLISIFHDCHEDPYYHYHRMSLQLPSEYTSRNKLNLKVFDVGVLNLESITVGQEHHTSYIKPKKAKKRPQKQWFSLRRMIDDLGDYIDVRDQLW